MDSAFLILVAIPLGIFVIALLLNTRDLGDEPSHDETVLSLAEPTLDLTVVEPHTEYAAASDATGFTPTTATDELLAAAASSDAGTIEDTPISSKVVLAHESTPSTPAQLSDTETKADTPSTVSADTLTAESEATSVETVAALPTAQAETAANSTSESALDSTAQLVVSETNSAAESVADAVMVDSPQDTEPEPDAAAETAAETASQPIVAEELEANPAVPKPLPEPESPSIANEANEPDEDDPILPEGPVVLPEKGSPKYAFDYRGRLWVEKKNKGFFRQLRRPQLPPEDPSNNSQR